jgi:hypothetical protein
MEFYKDEMVELLKKNKEYKKNSKIMTIRTKQIIMSKFKIYYVKQ